jgi:ATP-dependent DNA helicase RecQ
MTTNGRRREPGHGIMWCAAMRGQTPVRLFQPKKGPRAATRHEQQSWEGVDRGLFDRLRAWRREVAMERGVPPYMILQDSTLRGLAALRPTQLDMLRGVWGMGERRLADFGQALIEVTRDYCHGDGQDGAG